MRLAVGVLARVWVAGAGSHRPLWLSYLCIASPLPKAGIFLGAVRSISWSPNFLGVAQSMLMVVGE